MPTTVEYSNNPNEETAFVTPEGGQRTRTVLTTPVDGTVKYPDNPNSTKVSVVVDGVARKAVAVYNVGGGGDSHNLGWYATSSDLQTAHPTASAGDWAIVGATDTVWVWDTDTSAWVDTDTKGEVTPDMIIVKSSTMPTASTTPAGAVYQYTGTTSGSYTHGYIYENKVTTTYTGTVSFNPASLSSTTVACSGDDFAAFVAEWGSGNITDIIKGTLTYDQSGGLLVFVGLDDTDTQVCTFQLYTQDYEDAGFTFTGTLQDGDVINFTTTISETSSYAWERIDVQPAPEALPSQTGNSGKFLTTDGTSPSWSDKPLVNKATGFDSLAIGTGYTGATGTQSVAIGPSVTASGFYGIGIGNYVSAGSGIAIGRNINIDNGASGSIIIGKTNTTYTNNDPYTFKIVNDNGNFEMMSADGTIPTARLTNAINKYSSMPTAGADYLGQIAQFTGTTDATYTHGYIYECVSDGGNPPTYSWTAVSVQAGGGSLPSQTGNSGKFLTTDGTDASWGNALTNTGTGTGSFATGTGATTTDDLATAIGENASAGYCSTVVGSGSSASATSYGSVIIGQGASVTGSAYDSGGTILIQAGRSVNKNCIIIGRMQPGVGNYQGGIFLNSTNTGVSYYGDLRDTFWITVGTNSQYKQYQITDANGRFPIARMADTTNAAQGQVLTLDANNNAVWQTPSTAVTSTTATLAVNDWSSNTQTVNVTGVTANNLVQVAPAPSSNSDYVSGGVLCTAQGVGTLTFTCTTTPTNAITVNVVIFG